MVAKHPAKLRHFLVKGPQLDLKQLSGEVDDDDEDDDVDENHEDSPFNLHPDKDAESKIPKAWLTPERILSVEFADEVSIDDVKESEIPRTVEEMYDEIESAYIKWEEQSYASSMLSDQILPLGRLTVDLTRRNAFAFSATWSNKTPKDSPYYPAFIAALARYMKFRKFVVPVVKTERELAKLDAPRPDRGFVELKTQPDYIPHQLMDFQLEGVNFCY